MFLSFCIDDGQGVTVYVLDSGILPNHEEFGGRARVGYDVLGGNVSIFMRNIQYDFVSENK